LEIFQSEGLKKKVRLITKSDKAGVGGGEREGGGKRDKEGAAAAADPFASPPRPRPRQKTDARTKSQERNLVPKSARGVGKFLVDVGVTRDYQPRAKKNQLFSLDPFKSHHLFLFLISV